MVKVNDARSLRAAGYLFQTTPHPGFGKMQEVVSIRPADLMLDEENPRLAEPNSGQRAALRSLAERQGPKLEALVRDIVDHGTDPSALLMVVPDAGSPSRYVVLEGNRRLAAVRLLENPEVVRDAVKPTALKRLRSLSAEYLESPLEELNCVVFPDRDAARHWIELRHTGENKGAGVVPWGSEEASRYQSRGAAPPHTQALDFLESRGLLPAEVRRQVPVTSLRRLLSTPAVRQKLGVETKGGRLTLLGDGDGVAKALSYVVEDLASGNVPVKKIYTSKQREQYAAAIPEDIVVSAAIGADGQSGAAATDPPRKKKRRRRSKPQRRDKLIPADCELGIPTGRIGDIEIELRQLSLRQHPNAIAVLLRVFLELSVDHYRHKRDLDHDSDSDPKLHTRMLAVIDDLVERDKMTRQQARPARRVAQKKELLCPSISSLNDWAHNEYDSPAEGDLRACWDQLQSMFAAIWHV